MSTKIPPRPRTSNNRIIALVKRCIYIRKKMGLNRKKFLAFLNGQFLCKQDRVSYHTICMWEWDKASNWPSGECALALAAFERWATEREKSLGYFYMHVPAPKTHTIWDENLKPHVVPYEEPEWAKQVATSE